MEGRRILAIRTGALGDTILVLPALAALRRSVGDSGTVEFVGTEPAHRLAESPKHASCVHANDRGIFRALYAEEVDDTALVGFLLRFDFVVAWSRLSALKSKRERLGISGIEIHPDPPDGVHASDHLYSALAPLGISGPAPAPELVLGEESRRGANEFLRARNLSPGRFVAIHPSSGSPRKNWPLERVRAFASLVRSAGREIVWIEGEADSQIVRSLGRSVAAPVARGLSLDVLGALVAEAAVFVGNDSGVTHLAASAGAPTLALFGPTSPLCWAPRGASVSVVDFGISAFELWEKALERIEGR